MKNIPALRPRRANPAATLALLFSAAIAAASVPVTQRFDLSAGSNPQWNPREVNLYDATVLQSFARDNVNHTYYTVQVTQGSDPTLGNLTVTKLDWTGQTILGHMHLTGFGHGVQIGVEPVGTDAYLWTEVDAQVNGTTSRGNKLARFKFVNGQTLANTSASLTKYVLVSGQYNTTGNVDMAHGYLVMRYHTGGSPRFALYNLAAVKAGGTTALCDVPQPAGLGNFQGFTSYGSYLYLLSGDAYSTSNPAPGNTRITVVDLNTGLVVDQQQTNAGTTLTYREPEGMSVLNYGSDHRLQFGFATGSSGARQASVYYKNVLIVGAEAEDLSYTGVGAGVSLISDAAASGGAWVSLGSTGIGQFMEFTSPTIPAGTYVLKLAYKSYSGRGKLQVSIDGSTVGTDVDQYATTQTYKTASVGTVTFGSAGSHVIRLTVTGRNAASSGYLLSADAFQFVLQ